MPKIPQQFVEKRCGDHEFVMSAKAGIQQGIDLHETLFLDPGFLRGDESFFNKLLKPRARIMH